MNNRLRNLFFILGGMIVGMILNEGIIMLIGKIIPLPPGADFSSLEKVIASMPLLQPIHFLMPFLAHALGTFAGALFAARYTEGTKLRSAIIIGIFFLIGGILAAKMIPAPLWFTVTDLVLAYIPFAWLGYFLAQTKIKDAAQKV